VPDPDPDPEPEPEPPPVVEFPPEVELVVAPPVGVVVSVGEAVDSGAAVVSVADGDLEAGAEEDPLPTSLHMFWACSRRAGAAAAQVASPVIHGRRAAWRVSWCWQRHAVSSGPLQPPFCSGVSFL
jgi:hypothetical protein